MCVCISTLVFVAIVIEWVYIYVYIRSCLNVGCMYASAPWSRMCGVLVCVRAHCVQLTPRVTSAIPRPFVSESVHHIIYRTVCPRNAPAPVRAILTHRLSHTHTRTHNRDFHVPPLLILLLNVYLLRPGLHPPSPQHAIRLL